VTEVGVGDLEGNTDHESLREFGRVFAAWARGELTATMPGGETGHQIRDRYVTAVAGIRAGHAEGTVVLVSHGAVIRLVAPLLAPNVDPPLTAQALLPNTGRVVLVTDPEMTTGWRCVEWTGVLIDDHSAAE
jgi:broad specificity phosphatase PhoE